MSEEPIIVTADFRATRDEVWSAITEPHAMREWFFNQMDDFRPEEGFETRFTVEVDDVEYIHLWKIVEVVPLQKIVYDWRYEGIPGQGLVTFELSDEGSGSRITLTNTGIETFPQDNPLFTRESAIGGWSYLLQQSLVAYLDEFE